MDRPKCSHHLHESLDTGSYRWHIRLFWRQVRVTLLSYINTDICQYTTRRNTAPKRLSAKHLHAFMLLPKSSITSLPTIRMLIHVRTLSRWSAVDGMTDMTCALIKAMHSPEPSWMRTRRCYLGISWKLRTRVNQMSVALSYCQGQLGY